MSWHVGMVARVGGDGLLPSFDAAGQPIVFILIWNGSSSSEGESLSLFDVAGQYIVLILTWKGGSSDPLDVEPVCMAFCWRAKEAMIDLFCLEEASWAYLRVAGYTVQLACK